MVGFQALGLNLFAMGSTRYDWYKCGGIEVAFFVAFKIPIHA